MVGESQLFARFGRVVPAGVVLFREGEQGLEMYIIQSGKVRISKRVRHVDKTLAILDKGEFFGEMAILNDKPRSASAEVLEDSEILVIDRKTFETMIRTNAEIALRIMRKLAERLQEADNQIENLMIRDNTMRLVDVLARLAKAQTPGAFGIEIRHSSDELAGMAGLAKEQVIAVLDKLVKARVIDLREGSIHISNKDHLVRLMKFLEMKDFFGDFS
jgi:CRP-like cAMP-binding protein